MRLLFAVFMAACLLAMFAVGATAGDYHTGTKLKCFQCHIMHATKSHVYSDDSHDHWGGDGAVDSYGKLLKFSDVNELCLSCHDNGSGRDVFGAITDTTYNRIAGWFSLSDNATVYSGSLNTPYGHNLNNGSEIAPGGTKSYTLDCATCHDPHGNEYYRNLNDLAGDGSSGITYATGVNDLTKDVFQLGGSRKFDAPNVSYNLPTPGSHSYEAFCVSCHTDVHSDVRVGGHWMKHPTVGSSLPYTDGTVSPLKTLGGSPLAGEASPLVAGDVSCMTCHKAHGSDHSFSLIYDNRTTAELEDSPATPTGSNSVRMTCKHCHDKGLSDTE